MFLSKDFEVTTVLKLLRWKGPLLPEQDICDCVRVVVGMSCVHSPEEENRSQGSAHPTCLLNRTPE